MRYLGLAVDDGPAGGTAFDDVVAGAIDPPTAIVPVTTGQANANERTISHANLVTGFRGQLEEEAFAAAPELTFEAPAFPKLLRDLLPRGMGGAIASTGVTPAAIESTVQMALSGAQLPALVATLIREGQVDRLTGCWPNELEFNFPADEDGTVSATLWGLYHDVDAAGSVAGLPSPDGSPEYTGKKPYKLRDIVALMGDGAGVQIGCLGGFGFTINNNLIEDLLSRYCAGKNIFEVVVDGDLHRIWYPDKNKLGPQTITGRLDYGDVQPDRELRRILRHSEKLVVELAGDPLPGTVPAADEMVRLIFHKQAPTGGSADPLQREGDQRSSYEFTAYIDPAIGKDFEATFVGTDAIDLADPI